MSYGGKTASLTVTIQSPVDSDTPQIVIESKTATPGQDVNVLVSLKNHSGVAGFDFGIEYDGNKLEYSGAEERDFPGVTELTQEDENPFYLGYHSTSDRQGTDIALLKFQVKTGASGNAKISIYMDDMCSFNNQSTAFKVDTSAVGVINIQNYKPGNVDNSEDGKINSADATRLKQVLAHWKQANYNKDAADVDGNGYIQSADATRLLQVLAHWKGVQLLPGRVSERLNGKLLSVGGENAVLLNGDASLILDPKSGTAIPGQEVEVLVSLKNHSGVAGFDFGIEYDGDKLEYSGAEERDFPGVTELKQEDENPFYLGYHSTSDSQGTDIALLKFKVKAGASGNAKISIYMDDMCAFNNQSTVFDVDTSSETVIEITDGSEPESKTLESIAVTTKPTKTAYTAGETFDPAGMAVTATYSDGTTAAVTGYSTSPTTALKVSDTTVTVSYSEDGVTKTATVDIAVTEPGSNPNPGGCYVATSVYGSYDCPEVWTLRRFRDDVLAQTWYGRLFIRLYYAVSPTAVKLFGDSQWFQSFFRDRLDKMVSGLQADGFESTPYEDRAW